MEIFDETIERELPDLAAQGVRVRFIGRRDRAPEALRTRMAALEDETSGNDRLDLWIAFDYGGRAELVDAARRLVEAGMPTRRGRRGRFRGRASTRPGAARPGPADPHVRRAADLELPALAARLRGARLRRQALAGLRRGRPARRARRVRAPPAPLRRPVSALALRSRDVCSSRSRRRCPLVLGLRLARRLVAVRARASSAARRAARVLRDDARRCGRSCSPATRGRCCALLGAQLGGVDVDGRPASWRRSCSRSCSRASPTRARRRPSRSGTTVLGAAWIGLGLGHLILLRDIPEHAQLATFTVLLAVWAGDTVAYFAGRLVGRHKLAPTISPGKTWEGFVGGTIAPSSSRSSRSTTQHFLADLAVARPRRRDRGRGAARRPVRVGAQARHEVKDTRPLLAGHGGMLDRIDALLFAVAASFYARSSASLATRPVTPVTACSRGSIAASYVSAPNVRPAAAPETPVCWRREAGRAARRHRLDRAPGARDHRRASRARARRRRLRLDSRSTGSRR